MNIMDELWYFFGPLNKLVCATKRFEPGKHRSGPPAIECPMPSFPALAGKLQPLGEDSDWRGLRDPGSARARIPDRHRADRIGQRELVSRDTAAPTGATRLGLLRVVPTGSRPGVRIASFRRGGLRGGGLANPAPANSDMRCP